ncbi:hypothetical protein D1953_06740 [Peribacillus asahii]|uniref:Uncharacterized protein n=1 Tax=Peribacillus asahii TaxID=228899 RepID=A0A398BB14_9BACI|nr:hypothetical protein D1953_06740 [Peribacillus asahii]
MYKFFECITYIFFVLLGIITLLELTFDVKLIDSNQPLFLPVLAIFSILFILTELNRFTARKNNKLE